MSWRWGQLTSRPITERDRVRAFWICAAILAAAAALLFSLPDTGPAPETEPAPSPGQYGSAELPPPPEGTAPPLADERGAELAARRFVPGYLAFVSGQGPAASLRGAAPPLVSRLSKSRLRVPPAARNRPAQLIELDPQALDAERVAVTARVSDGPVTFSIELTIERLAGRWLVTAVGAD
jgi:hypothetical protein